MAVHGDNAAQSLVLSNISGNPTLRQISTTTPQTNPPSAAEEDPAPSRLRTCNPSCHRVDTRQTDDEGNRAARRARADRVLAFALGTLLVCGVINTALAIIDQTL
ncbi:hypothetical protein ACFFQW_28930 [Umezawaea endophytica]|uniref:Uncharacterized protein n=1 Tax=Umezawaea endophytica TaxID=1654476 RepID=A0A9X3AJ68_9PSEU|nr:hypothetical protein [Umezawaea endophytica]MCS7484142.1 hypothetical protein [Umezawaea endophytica]